MANVQLNTGVKWRSTPLAWALWLGLAVCVIFVFYAGLKSMVLAWYGSEEYGYGFIVPLVTAFLIWQKKNVLHETPFTGSWLGVVVVIVGLVFYFIGTLSALFVVMQYAFLVVLAGLVLSCTGWRGFQLVWPPMLILVFMVPLPGFFYNNLSSFLQLLSSEIGVDVIRLFRVPVHLSGNVIDLGVFKLQVAEACSGLRYLFPLVSLSFIAAYFYRAPFWKRAVVVLSSLPITVLMNSARIGVIGILVDYAGIAQAQGFLHYFEGWVVFMMCLAILLGEMVLLSKFGPDRTKAFHEIFRIDWPDAVSRTGNEVSRGIPTTLWISALLLLLGAAVGATLIGNRQEIIPPRTDFSQFPARIGAWTGRFDRMRQIYLTALKLSDYVMADYTRPNGGLVNFYVAYYKSQMAGGSVHSPRSCIPGGGWLIKKLDQKTIPGVVLNGRPLRVNRVLIRKGNNVQVVYYWFQERGRDLTNEYVVKWYLFWDALTRNRTDGALVRVTAFVPPGADPASTDQELVSFLRQVVPLLPKYLPN